MSKAKPKQHSVLRQANLEEAIHPTKGEKNQVHKTETWVFTFKNKDYDGLFNLNGEEDEKGFPVLLGDNSEDLEEAYAKMVYKGLSISYFVKVNHRHELWNPLGMDENRHHNRLIRERWTFKKVNRRAFEQYLQFLRTGNLARLSQAQQESI